MIVNNKNIKKEAIVDVSRSKYTYDEMVKDLKELKYRYSGLIYIDVIGKSHDDRCIYQITIGNENAKKHVLIHGGIHGREYLTSLLIMKQIEYYLNDYEDGEYKGVKYKNLFNSVAFHLIPMANPDGIVISQIGIEGLRDEELREVVYRCYENDLRENYTYNNFPLYLTKWKANAIGVDLNRNFNAGWESLNQVKHPSFENYKGIKYHSEPESKALVELVERYNFVATISYHSSGSLIYWDYIDSLVREDSSKMADVVAALTNYEKAESDESYYNVVSGGFKDWASSKKENPIPSITIEIGYGESPLDISEFKSIWNSNFKLWGAIAKLKM